MDVFFSLQDCELSARVPKTAFVNRLSKHGIRYGEHVTPIVGDGHIFGLYKLGEIRYVK